MNIVKITAEACGGWHDKPLQWAVHGPGSEVQKFSLKKAAKIYLRIRKQACNQYNAINTFVRDNCN